MECLASFPLSTRVGCCFVREKAIDLRTRWSGQEGVPCFGSAKHWTEISVKESNFLCFRPTHSTWSVVPIIDSFLGEFLTQWTVFGLIVLRSEIILLAVNAKHDVEKHSKKVIESLYDTLTLSRTRGEEKMFKNATKEDLVTGLDGMGETVDSWTLEFWS
ncbi:hypothetical protein TNCV_162681 [Trichonephila clavipes]|nr:hypothetical protein TNCV_162681 [Trichonephila clavipes]